jgi:hypothetical protein
MKRHKNNVRACLVVVQAFLGKCAKVLPSGKRAISAWCSAYELVAAMSLVGTSRFTALLAAVALSGTAGTFWWALETRSDMKAASTRAFNHTAPVKAGGRVPHWKDEHPAKAESNKEPEAGKYELMGRSERSQQALQAGAGGRTDDPDQAASERSIPSARLINFPVPASNYSSPEQIPTPTPGAKSGRADMPLPAMLAKPDPAPAPALWQSRAPDPVAYAPPPTPAPPPPPEIPRRQVRDPKPEAPTPAATARSFRPSPSFYTEQYIEQGEFRYRRRPCEPPNMPDVCYMPQADRHPIVVAKP